MVTWSKPIFQEVSYSEGWGFFTPLTPVVAHRNLLEHVCDKPDFSYYYLLLLARHATKSLSNDRVTNSFNDQFRDLWNAPLQGCSSHGALQLGFRQPRDGAADMGWMDQFCPVFHD